MATYKNDYTKEEDHTLWELHEIRHALHEMIKNKNIDQINKDSGRKYKAWRQENEVKKAG
jgi:hypothetical protein